MRGRTAKVPRDQDCFPVVQRSSPFRLEVPIRMHIAIQTIRFKYSHLQEKGGRLK